jgi:hypothetical protein
MIFYLFEWRITSVILYTDCLYFLQKLEVLLNVSQNVYKFVFYKELYSFIFVLQIFKKWQNCRNKEKNNC